MKYLTLTNNREIFVPKIKLEKVKNLALKKSRKLKIIGKRPGKKIEEILITKDEEKSSIEKKICRLLSQTFG